MRWWKLLSKEKLKKLKEDFPDYKKYKYPTLNMRWRIEEYGGYTTESYTIEEWEEMKKNNDPQTKRKTVDEIVEDIIRNTTDHKDRKRLKKDFPENYKKVEKENK